MKLEREALFQKLFKKLVWNRSISVDFLRPSQRFMDLVAGYNTASGQRVSVERAEKLATVYNCINIISQTVGALPFVVKQKIDDGKFDATTHPVYNLLKNKPNRYMTAMNFWMVNIQHLLARGNAYVLIEKDDRGNVVALWPLDSKKMQINTYEGEVYYQYEDFKDPFLAEDLLHFKMYTQNGVVGISPILQNAESIGAHIKQTEYSIKMLGEKPPGYLTEKIYSGPGGQKFRDKADTNIKEWQRGIKENGIPYLAGDVQYVPLMIPPEEAQYIETRKLTKLEIMAMYRTPPEMHQIYEDSNYSLSESTAINFGKYCVTPVVTCIEQECNSKLFEPGNATSATPKFVRANMNAIYRADLKTTGEFYQTMVGAGIYNADRVLSLLDENPQPNGQGKTFYIQSGFMPKELSEQFWRAKGDNKAQDPSEAARKLSHEELYEIYLNKVKEGEADE